MQVTVMPNATDLETFLAPYPPDVREIALATRYLLAEVLPGAAETIDASAKLFGYGYGPGYKGCVCTLLLSKTGVKIGIARFRINRSKASHAGQRQSSSSRAVADDSRSKATGPETTTQSRALGLEKTERGQRLTNG